MRILGFINGGGNLFVTLQRPFPLCAETPGGGEGRDKNFTTLMNTRLCLSEARAALRTWLFLSLSLLAVLPAAGQGFSVSGRAVDDSLRQPVPFLAAQLLLPDSSLYAVALTDSLGRFVVETDRGGDYTLRLSGVGFDLALRRVRLSAGAPRADVGDVALHDCTVRLSEATVTGKASTLTVRRDTFVYSTKAMDFSAGATLAAALSQMPGVTMDDEGNVIWQGKKVESLLVGGQKFLGGDIQKALRNLPAEVVESLKLYDRSSEEAERTGVDDGERTTVMDVGIKAEYRGVWAGNADVGAGYDEKWTGRAFLSNFSDRVKIGVAALANNLNGGERVTPEGDWYQSEWKLGWNTYRNVSASVDWSNKNDRSAAGYQHLEANLYYSHDNQDYRYDTEQQNYVPGEAPSWQRERGRSWSGKGRLQGRVDYRWNVDSLNFLTLSYAAHRIRGRGTSADRSAQFLADPAARFPGDPVGAALDPALPDSLRRLLVNTMRADGLSRLRHSAHWSNLTYMHRLSGRKDLLALSFEIEHTRESDREDQNYDARYFAAGERRDPERQHNDLLERKLNLWGRGEYRRALADGLWWNNVYTFTFSRGRDDHAYYRLESLPGWDDLGQHPLGEVPADLGARPELLNRNSYASTRLLRSHQLSTGVSGTAKKLQLRATVAATWNDEALRYDRPAVLHTTQRRYEWTFQGDAWLKYAFTDRTLWEVMYHGATEQPEMKDLLPVGQTVDPQNPTRGNPDLKSWFSHYVYSRFSTFFEPSQVSLAFSGYCQLKSNGQDYRMDYDPATGYFTQTPVNTGRNVRGQLGMDLTWTLDRQKRWTYDAALRSTAQRSAGYVGTAAATQLNRVRTTDLYARSGLAYRQGDLFVKLSAGFMPQFIRSTLQPESNETGYTYTYGLTASYTLPWGMKLSSDFTMTSRRAYTSPTYNTDEPIWNAYVQQDFLRDKSLTLKLEAADMLAGQKDIFRYTSSYSAMEQHENGFQRYVVLHVVWRFSGKRR